MDLCERLFCQLLFPRARNNFESQPLSQHEHGVIKVLRKKWRFDKWDNSICWWRCYMLHVIWPNTPEQLLNVSWGKVVLSAAVSKSKNELWTSVIHIMIIIIFIVVIDVVIYIIILITILVIIIIVAIILIIVVMITTTTTSAINIIIVIIIVFIITVIQTAAET